jgi:uncharacterized phage infection (PIP) family protein YhgE
MAGKQ